MDPNATLAKLRHAIESFEDQSDPILAEIAAQEMFEAAQDLDEWLSKGGFLPDAWVTKAGDCPRCNSHDDDLSARGGICESCYQEENS